MTPLWGAPRTVYAQSSPESGDQGSEVLRLNAAGVAAFKNKDYRHALESFMRAYGLGPDPNLLFNIGRCYEALGDFELALEKYRALTSDPQADASAKAKAEARISAINASRSAEAKPVVAPAEAISRASTEPADASTKPKQEPKGSLLKWVTLGAGVAFAGVGATLYVLGSNDHGKVKDAAGYGNPLAIVPMSQVQAQSYIDSGDLKKTLGVAGLAVGGVSVVASAVFFIMDKKGAESPRTGGAQAPRASWVLLPEAGGARLGVVGAF